MQLERSLLELGDLDDLVDQPGQSVERRLQLPDELDTLLVAHVRVLQHVRDALGHGHGCPELVRDVRQELRFRGRALRHLGLHVADLLLELPDMRERCSEVAPQQRRGASGEHDRSARGRVDGSSGLVHAVLLQEVAGGAAREHQRHPAGVAEAGPPDDRGERRRVTQPADEVDVLEALQPELGGDHVRLHASGHLDDPVGLGRDLDLHARVEHAQRMLEPGDLVGGVAEQNLHAQGIGPQTGGLRMSIGARVSARCRGGWRSRPPVPGRSHPASRRCARGGS